MPDAIPARNKGAGAIIRRNPGAIPTPSKATPATTKVATVARRPPTTSAHLPNKGENAAPPRVAAVTSIPICHRSMPKEEINSEARTPKTVGAKVAAAMATANTVPRSRRR